MKYILALDQGTTSSRAIVFDRAGRVKAVAQKEFPQIFLKPGWVEHDAGAIWKTQLATAKAALKKARLTAAHIAAIGITNQRETALLWNRETGKPIHNAIVWQDRRTAKECDRLRADGGASANNLLMQFQSDLLNVPVVRPRVTETTALGAAYLAGLAVGFWKSQKDIATQWRQDKRFISKMKPSARRKLIANWDKALGRSRNWED